MLLGTNRLYLFFKRYVAVRPTRTRREISNTLIVGPTRSGKGLLVVSQLLSWQHSVVVNDIKGELFRETAGYRATLGEVYVIDPTGVGHCFDPLLNKDSEDALYSAASHMLFQADERDSVFTDPAIGMLSRLFAASRIEGVAPLIEWRGVTGRPSFFTIQNECSRIFSNSGNSSVAHDCHQHACSPLGIDSLENSAGKGHEARQMVKAELP